MDIPTAIIGFIGNINILVYNNLIEKNYRILDRLYNIYL